MLPMLPLLPTTWVLAAHRSENNVRRRMSAFFRSEKLHNTSQSERHQPPPKLANSASIRLFVLSVLAYLPPFPSRNNAFWHRRGRRTCSVGGGRAGAAVPAPRYTVLRAADAVGHCESRRVLAINNAWVDVLGRARVKHVVGLSATSPWQGRQWLSFHCGAEQPCITPHYHAHAEPLERRADPLLPRAQPCGPRAARAALERVPLD